jgi:hypothetical protein
MARYIDSRYSGGCRGWRQRLPRLSPLRPYPPKPPTRDFCIRRAKLAESGRRARDLVTVSSLRASHPRSGNYSLRQAHAKLEDGPPSSSLVLPHPPPPSAANHRHLFILAYLGAAL